MALHRASGRRSFGLALASVTMLVWATLPVALTLLLDAVEPATIVWFRFTLSALVLGLGLAWRRRLPPLGRLAGQRWMLLAVATVFLAANYFTYLVGLDLTTPASAQVLVQLAPLFLALGGIFIFRERFGRVQWAGFAVLVLGLGVFFDAQVRALVAGADRYLAGALMMVFAAFTWAVYGLAQKQLLQWLPSQAIMVCVYAGSALLFAPLAEPAALLDLSGFEASLLVFCGLSTAVSYGTFSEALAHVEASRVAAVLALVPLATLAVVWVSGQTWPGALPAEPISVASLTGACCVVAGSLLASLGRVE
jgi:drug/metabolite transporter (DMT)-like permease